MKPPLKLLPFVLFEVVLFVRDYYDRIGHLPFWHPRFIFFDYFVEEEADNCFEEWIEI